MSTHLLEEHTARALEGIVLFQQLQEFGIHGYECFDVRKDGRDLLLTQELALANWREEYLRVTDNRYGERERERERASERADASGGGEERRGGYRVGSWYRRWI